MKKIVLFLTLSVLIIGCQQNDEFITNDEIINQGDVIINAKAGYSSPMIVSDRSSNGGCWCTEYVWWRITDGQYGANFTTAYKWHTWLINNGYFKVSYSKTNLPQNRDVIVFQRGILGMSSTAGHVAFVGAAWANTNNSITVNVVGANQGGTLLNRCSCPNESTIQKVVTVGMYGVDFYRKSNPTIYCR